LLDAPLLIVPTGSGDHVSHARLIPEWVSAIEVDDEAVIVDEFNGHAYSLNSIASFVWAGLADGLTVMAVVDELSEVFTTPRDVIETAVTQVVHDFGQLGVVGDRTSGSLGFDADGCGASAAASDPPADRRHAPSFDGRYLAAPPNY
jgi:hypothetical protein